MALYGGTTFVECVNSYGIPFPLINYTPYTWTLGYTHQYQMDNWNWPKTVAPGSYNYMCVQPGQSGTIQDDAGEATYSIGSTGDSFQLQYRSSTLMQVELINMVTQGNANLTTIKNLAAWILVGQHGNYISNNIPAPDWMQNNLNYLGARTVREICIPGAHDAGMSQLNNPGPFSNRWNTATQPLPILGQLTAGVRWFDLRPCLYSGTYVTCHITPISTSPGYVGGSGQSLASVVSDINTFTASHNELIIIDISHGYDMTAGPPATGFTDAQWAGAFQVLSGVNHLFTGNLGGKTLDQLPLSTYIAGKKSAVLMISQDTNNLSSYAGKGFYPASSLPNYNAYANSDDSATTANDQIKKMNMIRTSQDSEEFLASWTLTQTTSDAAGAGTGGKSGQPETSIIAGNYYIWPGMFQWLAGNSTQKVYPNILLQDAAGCWQASATDYTCHNTTDAVSLCMGFNYLGLSYC